MFQSILDHFKNNENHLAFCINETYYSYGEFAEIISSIQEQLVQNNFKHQDIGVVHIYDDIYTYASIFALWFSGGIFLPLNPSHQKNRNERILKQVNPTITLSSHPHNDAVLTSNLKSAKSKIPHLSKWSPDMLLYIIFTSGSTGVPKGVPIAFKNMKSYIFNKIKDDCVSNEDRFIQIYDLTFDASFQSYLLPLVAGASVFTVSPTKIKYLEVLRILNQHQITYAKINNSIITFLKPYFEKIHLPSLKYCIFAGEGLDAKLVQQWRVCIPNATMQNVYGPTEATVNTHKYIIPTPIPNHKTHNGIVGIGKPFGDNKSIIIDEQNQIVKQGEQGELCLSGPQVTSGYWNDLPKTQESFFKINLSGKTLQFYKTGDLVYEDKDGDYIFCGRKDEQVKILGYRVELSEIENITKKLHAIKFVKAIAHKNKTGILEIYLFVASPELSLEQINQHLKSELPRYMLPSKVILIPQMPFTTSGKIDSQMLKKTYLS